MVGVYCTADSTLAFTESIFLRAEVLGGTELYRRRYKDYS